MRKGAAMLTEEQNRLLTDVEGDAPMARMMRQRYWIPCARSASLVADGAPQRVRLLGRNYVAFRATDGRIGFFDEACPHRGVSLTLARNEDCALRCIFHGWKIDVAGTVVDIPSEGDRGAQVGAKIKVNHYPTFEGGGLLWVWLGQGTQPARPPMPFFDLPQENIWITRTISPSNWFQGVEGTLDSVHVGTLHQSWIARLPSDAGKSIGLALQSHPRYEVADTGYGLRAAAIRGLADGQQYVRVTEYVMPFVSLVPASLTNREGTSFISVPIDNNSHMLFWGFWSEDKVYQPQVEKIFANGERDLDHYATFHGGVDNAWGQDRAAMAQGHFTGFDDCLLQEDVVVQASMGLIVDRTKEQLIASDIAVARARRRLLEEVAAFEAAMGEDPPHDAIVRPIDIVADGDYRWQEQTALV